MLALANRLDRLVSRVGQTAMWLFLPLVGIILFDVITRKIPGFSYTVLHGWLGDAVTSTKLQELEWHLHAALFALVLGWSYLRNAQVRVDLLREKAGTRLKLWIELLGALVFLMPFSLLLLWYGVDFAKSAYATGEGSAAMTGLPYRWIIKTILLFGVALLFLAGLAVLLRVIAALREPTRRSFEEAVFPDNPHTLEIR